ncbi:hypothetical protein ONZ45_g13545 [Pleurotus djamor]|nr:hypothetical protein ONZ45_g13545 [Pleurotus djamor]
MSLQDFPNVRSLTIYSHGTYVPVASACLFFYDYLLTINDERRYIWRTQGNAGKALFALTRYLAFGDAILAIYRNTGHHLPQTACRVLYDASGWFVVVGVTVAEIILLLRVWALWNQSRPVGVCIFLVLSTCLVTSAVVFGHSRQTNSGCFGRGCPLVLIQSLN